MDPSGITRIFPDGTRFLSLVRGENRQETLGVAFSPSGALERAEIGVVDVQAVGLQGVTGDHGYSLRRRLRASY